MDSAYLAFQTEVTGGAKAERMRITSAGNVTFENKVAISSAFTAGELLGVKGDTGGADWGARIENTHANGLGALVKVASSGTGQALEVRSGSTSLFKVLANGASTFNGDVSVPATNKLRLDGASGHSYIYEHSNDDVRVYVGGTAVWDFLTTGAGVSATGKLHLDGGGDTYIQESSANVLKVFTGGTQALEINASQNATFAGEIVYSSTANKLRTSTSDGSDNASIIIDSTGGGGSSTRGAYIALYGNEHANDGIIDIQTGNETASQINFRTGGGTSRMVIDANSRISLSNNDGGSNNTIFGKSASPSQAGANNTIIGENTALAMDGGESHNIVIGNNAMRGADEGASGNIDFNIAIGSSALWGGVLSGTNQVTGNIAIGYQSLYKIADTNPSLGQVAIGYQSLKSTTSGNLNTSIGYLAGTAITIGEKNTMLGAYAGYSSLLPDNCTLVGYNAGGSGVMTANADGTVAIGFSALQALTSGGRNLAIGYQSLDALTEAFDNIGIGYNTLGASLGVCRYWL